MASGGKRPNSGPKKGVRYAKTLGREETKQMLRDLLMPHLQEVAAALVARSQSGENGDVAAIKEFFERLAGKVTEEIDHTSGGKPIFLPSQLMDKYKLNDTDKGPSGDSE